MAQKSRVISALSLFAALALTLGAGGCGDSGTHAAQDKPKESKPADKPADGKQAKPDEKKPAEGNKPDEKKSDEKKYVYETLSVPVGGKTFKLDLAITPEIRMKGLGQRSEIAADGGMLFVFKDSEVRVQKFVMRDCPVPIDIIYLDGAGRVLAMYEMKAEAPRNADGSEGKVGDFDNSKYESRLPSYSSRYPAQFVIELKGGTLPTLKLKVGDKIEADWAALKKRAK